MFWNGCNKKLNALSEKSSHLERELEVLRGKLRQAEQTEKTLRQQLSEKESQLALHEGIFSNMHSFNVGFGALQQSLATLANTLSAEQQARHLGDTMGTSSIRGFVELTKTDHMLYKFHIYQILMGTSDKNPEEFADHTSCRLGKWYYEGIGKQTCSHLPAFRNLEQPHKEVHDYGIEAINCYRRGEGKKAIEALDKMERASLKVMENLEEIAVTLQAESAQG